MSLWELFDERINVFYKHFPQYPGAALSSSDTILSLMLSSVSFHINLAEGSAVIKALLPKEVTFETCKDLSHDLEDLWEYTQILYIIRLREFMQEVQKNGK